MRRGALLLGALIAGGCASTPTMTTTQMDAIQVREVDAPPDRAFAAATDAVIDAGFTIEVSDGEGGLITAVRRGDPSVAEHAAVLTLSVALSLLTGVNAATLAHSRLYGVGVQVLPRMGGWSSVRIHPYGNGDLESDRREIAELWTLMQRQVLVKERPVD